MINLEWQGGQGYGDVVGPICYAHNISYHLNQTVNLILHWKTPKGYLYRTDTPEPLYTQAEIINAMCEKSGTDVTIRFEFDSSYEKRFNNYYEEAIYDDPKHNEWKVSSAYKHSPISGKIVVNSILQNLEPFDTYSNGRKVWKDVQGKDWSPLIFKLKELGYDVVEVGYRTPIKECIEEIRTCEVFISYHGATLWLARLIGVPCLVTSTGIMREVFNRAHICGKIDVESQSRDSIEQYIEIAKFRNSYHAYDMNTYTMHKNVLRCIRIE